MAGRVQLKFVMTECSKTQICLTRPILYLYFVIKADTCSLAEAAPPQPQDKNAMKRALLSLRI